MQIRVVMRYDDDAEWNSGKICQSETFHVPTESLTKRRRGASRSESVAAICDVVAAKECDPRLEASDMALRRLGIKVKTSGFVCDDVRIEAQDPDRDASELGRCIESYAKRGGNGTVRVTFHYSIARALRPGEHVSVLWPKEKTWYDFTVRNRVTNAKTLAMLKTQFKRQFAKDGIEDSCEFYVGDYLDDQCRKIEDRTIYAFLPLQTEGKDWVRIAKLCKTY